jgi:transposase InsO family protein
MIGRPLLTTLCDVYSSVVSGYHFGLGEPKLHLAVAALQHAMLRKHCPLKNSLLGNWAVYGVPEMLMVDTSTLWTSSNFTPLRHLLEKLGINLVRRTAPSAGATSERFFEGFSKGVKALLLKSTGRLAEGEGQNRLTLAQLDRLFVQYIVNEYNQSLHPRDRSQTRLEMWQSGLTSSPQVLLEQDFKV